MNFVELSYNLEEGLREFTNFHLYWSIASTKYSIGKRQYHAVSGYSRTPVVKYQRIQTHGKQIESGGGGEHGER